MKTLKLTLAALLVLGLSSLTVKAQDANPAKSTTKTTAAKSGSTSTNASGQHLKKDGTPDMRYKENKTAAKSTTPAKTTSTKSSAKGTTGSKGAAASGTAK